MTSSTVWPTLISSMPVQSSTYGNWTSPWTHSRTNTWTYTPLPIASSAPAVQIIAATPPQRSTTTIEITITSDVQTTTTLPKTTVSTLWYTKPQFSYQPVNSSVASPVVQSKPTSPVGWAYSSPAVSSLAGKSVGNGYGSTSKIEQHETML
jgi:hypothetical protein